MTVKWTFTDEVEGTTSVFTLNPESASIDRGGLQSSQISTTNGRRIIQKGRRNPDAMVINGTTFQEDEFVAFAQIASKMYQVKLTDDLGREFWVFITGYSPERQPTRFGSYAGASGSRLDWRMRYSINMTMLDWSQDEIF